MLGRGSFCFAFNNNSTVRWPDESVTEMKTFPRYSTSSLLEAQFENDSGSRVLKNKLGIKSKKEMDEAESVALKTTVDDLLGIYDENHCFTAADIRTMHKVGLG